MPNMANILNDIGKKCNSEYLFNTMKTEYSCEISFFTVKWIKPESGDLNE
jgi:hypothetical protein